jgi:hypothetical protein
MADLQHSGTTPVAREMFIMSVINGNNLSRHLENRKPGRGSSSQVLMGLRAMMVLIKSAVTGWNPLRGEPEKVGEGEDGL